MKVSFDYDGTLEKEEVKDFAQRLVDEGHELWIVTMRHQNRKAGNQDIYDQADALDIPKSRVIFTSGQLKNEFFAENEGFAFHLDDCLWQCQNIHKTTAIYYEPDEDWIEACENTLN